MNIKHFNAYSVPQRKLDVNIQTSVTRTFEGNVTENVSVPDQEVNEDSAQMAQLVDLGLPSGLKWATGNLVRGTNSNYTIGKETDYGLYFSWGNVAGHTNNDSYIFGSSTYKNSPAGRISANIANTDAQYDVARFGLGTPWHLPTKDDFRELYDNTDKKWTTIDGINGWKFMKKTNPSVYVFFPAAGNRTNNSIVDVDALGHYWSSSYISDTSAYHMRFNSSSVNPASGIQRHYGCSVRAVQ